MTSNRSVSEMVERARPLLDCTAKANHPIGHGERIVGFKLPEDVAGLSDGLFMLDALVELAKRGATLSSQAQSDDVVERVAVALEREFPECVDEGRMGFILRLARAALAVMEAGRG